MAPSSALAFGSRGGLAIRQEGGARAPSLTACETCAAVGPLDWARWRLGADELVADRVGDAGIEGLFAGGTRVADEGKLEVVLFGRAAVVAVWD